MEPTLDIDTSSCKKENPLAESRDFTPLELRYIKDAPELREKDSKRHITGYAASFRKLSRRLGGFHEQVMPTAFEESRAAGWPNVVCRYNHKPDFVLGTIHGGTLELDVDERGLPYDVIPPRHREDVLELVQRGDVRYSSFAFRCSKPDDDEWGVDDNGYPLRSLNSLELVDVAPVLDPAYFDTTASARNMAGVVESLSRHMNAEPEEVRSMLDEGDLLKFLKRTDRPNPKTEVRESEAPVSADNSTDERENSVETEITEEERAKLSSKARNDLPDSAFAYIDDKGGRHFPIHDEAHVRAALRLGPRSPHWPKAKSKVLAAAKRHGIDTSEKNSYAIFQELREAWDVPETDEERAAKASYEDLNTCGNCGAKDQWNKHCTQCGQPMREVPGKPAFCGECGSKIKSAQAAAPAKRENEEETEVRENEAEGSVDNSEGDVEDRHAEEGAKEEVEERKVMTRQEAFAKMAELRTQMVTEIDLDF